MLYLVKYNKIEQNLNRSGNEKRVKNKIDYFIIMFDTVKNKIE